MTQLWSDGQERVRSISCWGTSHPHRGFPGRQRTSHSLSAGSPWAACPGMPEKALNRLTSQKHNVGPQRGSCSRPKAGLAAQLAGGEPAARCPCHTWSRSARPQHITCTTTAHHLVLLADCWLQWVSRHEAHRLHHNWSKQRSRVPSPVPNPTFACLL